MDADGKSAKEEKMLQSLEGMLQGLESTGMTLPNKMRLIAIFIISQVPTNPLTATHHLRRTRLIGLSFPSTAICRRA